MTGLNQCVGTEGFFCIVRNTPEYHMSPQWYFSSRELEQYMQVAVRKKWDTSEVGARLEAFAVAGCNVTSTYLPLLASMPLPLQMTLNQICYALRSRRQLTSSHLFVRRLVRCWVRIIV